MKVGCNLARRIGGRRNLTIALARIALFDDRFSDLFRQERALAKNIGTGLAARRYVRGAP